MSRDNQVEIAPSRSFVGVASVLVLGLSACAHAKGQEVASASAVAEQTAKLESLEQRLAEREQLVTELESRLSLLEAEQRQLRYALAEREAAPVGLHETVRIGERNPGEERAPRERRAEARPVLRLYENHRSLEASTLEPVPVVSERLAVVPLPESLGLGKAKSTESSGDPYLAAIDMVRRRDFAAALGALSSFVREHPADERVGRALFWRGEVLFAQRQYVEALSAFETSLSREPKGEKAPDSLLKIGLCHKRLGAHERARAAMNQLKTQFPQSNAARLAQAEEA